MFRESTGLQAQLEQPFKSNFWKSIWTLSQSSGLFKTSSCLLDLLYDCTSHHTLCCYSLVAYSAGKKRKEPAALEIMLSFRSHLIVNARNNYVLLNNDYSSVQTTRTKNNGLSLQCGIINPRRSSQWHLDQIPLCFNRKFTFLNR